MARGMLVHRLLQSLPDIAPQARDRGRPAPSRPHGAGFTAEEREAMLGQVRRVLDDPRFAALFPPGSRAEVPIVGRLTHQGARRRLRPGRPPRGDRRCGADRRLQDQSPGAAQRLEDVPPAYVRQLALYRAVLGGALSRTRPSAPPCFGPTSLI